MTSKREREYERRRLEKWQERQTRGTAQRRRRNVIIGSVVGMAVVIGAIVLAALLGNDEPAAPLPTDTATTTSVPPEPIPSIDTAARVGNGGVLPAAAGAEGRAWTTTLTTNRGEITIDLDGGAAPQAVANFVTLARDGFFDRTKCHRLVTVDLHVLQCGDPTATGTGGPGYSWGPLENTPANDVYVAGDVAMARVSGDAHSMGSQFFLVYADSTIPADSAGGYTVFGHITSGLGVLEAIADEGTVTVGSLTAPVSDVIIEGVQTQ